MHRLGLGDRQRQQQFDGAQPAFLSPEAHGDGGDQQQEHPRQEIEERVQIGLAAIEEIAEVEGQRALQNEKDDDEHGGDRRGEVSPKFAAGDDPDIAHDQAASSSVSRRNTSSSLPDGCILLSSAGVASTTTRPDAITMARVQTASTSSSICVEMMIAFSGAHPRDQFAHLMLLVGIETVGRLVQHQHGRIMQQRLREADAALEAFRQRLDRLQPDALQPGQADRVGRPDRQFAAAVAAHPGAEAQEAGDRHLADRSARPRAGSRARGARRRRRSARRGP